jgi:hypothetical protein
MKFVSRNICVFDMRVKRICVIIPFDFDYPTKKSLLFIFLLLLWMGFSLWVRLVDDQILQKFRRLKAKKFVSLLLGSE